jgi:hypothetical protein
VFDVHHFKPLEVQHPQRWAQIAKFSASLVASLAESSPASTKQEQQIKFGLVLL